MIRSPAACLFLTLSLALALGAHARADPTPPDAPEVVRVTGVRAVPWKSYRAMRAALDAYEAHKDMAPNARFGFGVVLPPDQKLPPNFALRVRTPDGTEYPIEMQGRLFQLPIVPGNRRDADLVTNLKGMDVKIGIQMLTPDLPPGMDRLGDLRLYCEVMEAIDRVDEGFLVRLLRADPCKGADSRRWFVPPLGLPTLGAFLVEGERKVALARRDGSSGAAYAISLDDSAWSNDALIAYDFVEPFAPGRRRTSLRFEMKY